MKLTQKTRHKSDEIVLVNYVTIFLIAFIAVFYSWPDYLAQEWKAILLKSPIISFLNSFFNQISIVFQVLFGVPYSLSLILFFIIIIWVYVMFNIAGLVEAGGLFPGAYSYIAGFLVSIILAQFAVYEKVILFLGNLIFSPANMWVRTLIFAIVVFAFVLIEIGDRKLAEFLKSKRANEAQHKEELNRKFLETEVAEQRVRKK